MIHPKYRCHPLGIRLSEVLCCCPESGNNKRNLIGASGWRQISFVVAGMILAVISPTANAQTIATMTMTPGSAISIALSPQVTTTLLLPAVPSGTFGLGLVGSSGGNSGPGSIQIEHPDGSPILVLHPLSETAAVTMTVLMEGQLYVFNLRSAPSPDIAVTLLKADAVVPRAVEVTPEEIKAARVHYDPEILIGLLRRARDAGVLQPIYHDLYAGYSKRDTQYTSENDAVKTTVTAVHRFSKEDAVVLQCVVQNKLDRPISFDGRAATILVANEVHPVKLLDCLRPIPPHAQTLCDAVIQGDVDGGRANLSIENEFRLMLPPVDGQGTVWNLKNGGSAAARFKVPPPAGGVPLTQTGMPKKESQ
jgi:hypothetical protein